MSHRSNKPWPAITVPAAVIFTHPTNDHAALSHFGLTLLERQPHPVWRFEHSGRFHLILEVDASYVAAVRNLASRAGLQAKRTTLSSRRLFTPFTPKDVLVGPAPAGIDIPDIEKVRPTGLYLLVDDARASIAFRLVLKGLEVKCYTGRSTTLTYFAGWPALAHKLRAAGLTVRPAYGYPPDTLLHPYGITQSTTPEGERVLTTRSSQSGTGRRDGDHRPGRADPQRGDQLVALVVGE